MLQYKGNFLVIATTRWIPESRREVLEEHLKWDFFCETNYIDKMQYMITHGQVSWTNIHLHRKHNAQTLVANICKVYEK